MRQKIWIAVCFAFAALWWAAAVAVTPGDDPVAPRIQVVAIPVLENIDAHTVFAAYCADCHGAAGDGRGRVAAPLGIRPTDLTRVNQIYGEFDRTAEFYRLSHWHMVPDSDFQGWEEVLAHTYGPERARVMLSNLLVEIESMQASR